MKKQKQIATIIRLIARIWDSLILLFLFFFVGAHIFGQEGSGDGGFNSTSEMLTFYLCFPVGTMIGLALSWKWEGLGGLITVGAIIGLFAMRPDLIPNLLFIGIGVIGLLFMVYWVFTRGRHLETEKIGKEQRKTRRSNIVLALLIGFAPVVVFLLFMGLGRGNSINTEKDSSYNKKVKRVEVIATIEEPLIPTFAHSFEHSLVSALESNGIEVMVIVNQPEAERSEDVEMLAPIATLHINIKPLYRTRDDGYEAIVGTDYEVSLSVPETENRVWQARGKVDYIAMYSSNYSASEGVKKEFAWSTTAAIVDAFVAEVNDQKPARIYTVTEARQSHGQRVE